MVTFDDGSAVIALDAPVGVGASMRDRLGLRVDADGSASISLVNNQTGIPVRLVSDAEGGGGGVEFFEYDLPNRKATVKRIDFSGASTREMSLGGS